MVTPRFLLPFGLAALACLVVPLHAVPVAELKIPQMPEAWRQRVLRNPPGYEMLEPSDIIIGFWLNRGLFYGSVRDIPGDISLFEPRIAPGSTIHEGNVAWSQVYTAAEVPQNWGFLGSQTLGKVSIGWVAYVRVATYSPWEATTKPRPTEGAGFAYGAASLEEAIEEAATQAIAGFRRVGGARFETMSLEAGVSSKVDYALARSNGTWSNARALAFSVFARFPTLDSDPQQFNYRPQFPQEAKDLVPWLLAPEQQARKFGNGMRYWGTHLEPSHIPRKGMALPVFLWDRTEEPTSEAERQRRDESAAAALATVRDRSADPAARQAAIATLTEAAKRGHGAAQLELGSMLFHGNGVKADPVEGAAWIEEASKRGVPRAKETLFSILESAADGTQDARKVSLMEELAAAGHLDYFRMLASSHRDGRHGLAPNPAKSVEYLERGIAFDAAKVAERKEGYRDWLRDDLAAAYFRGEGTERNLRRVAELLRQSDTEGRPQGSGADLYRAMFYATGGFGFPRDPKRAAALLDNMAPEDWAGREDDYRVIRATVDAAQSMEADVAPAPAAKRKLSPEETLWSDHPEALAAIAGNRRRFSLFSTAEHGVGGAPFGPAKVTVSVLVGANGNVIEARVAESADAAYNAGALISARQAKFDPAGYSETSVSTVTVFFRPKAP